MTGARIDKRLDKWANKVYQLAWGPTSPETNLLHYTSLSGLKGILECGEVWASSVRMMNDSTELVYGEELVSKHYGSWLVKLRKDDPSLAEFFGHFLPEDYRLSQLFVFRRSCPVNPGKLSTLPERSDAGASLS